MDEKQPVQKRATMKDVARAAGVTIGTVSHVLNGTAPVSEETAARVRAAIGQLHYVPDLAARNMRRREKKLIGLLIPKLTNSFYARIASVLMDEAYRAGFTVLMLSYEYALEKERRGLRTMVENNAETIVIVNGAGDEAEIADLLSRGIHVILADRHSKQPGVSFVAYENRRILQEVVAHLCARGCTRIGYITEPLELNNLSDRFAGYQTALEKHGCAFRPEDVFISEQFRTDHVRAGRAYMTQLLAQRSRDALPQAFIVSSDLLAVGVMEGIRAAGLRVPEDFAIVGCDDLQISAYVQPPLTTILQDREALGRAIWQQALAWHEGSTPENIYLPQALVLRASC